MPPTGHVGAKHDVPGEVRRLPASRLPGSRKYHFLLEDVLATLTQHRIQPEPVKAATATRASKATATKKGASADSTGATRESKVSSGATKRRGR
jgi:hypothetical protein